jgi:hypothetical protein
MEILKVEPMPCLFDIGNLELLNREVGDINSGAVLERKHRALLPRVFLV